MKTKRKIRRKPITPYKPLPKGERGGVELLLIHAVEHVGKQGQVVEVAPPSQFFTEPRTDRARSFLAKILNH